MSGGSTPGKRALVALLLAGAAACGPDGAAEFSPTAHCRTRCEILFECVGQPTGPSDRDRAEFAECIDDCRVGLERPCEQEVAFECTECWQRRTCDEVENGRCDPTCLALCEG